MSAKEYESRTSEETAALVSDWMNRHGVKVESVFVPWSQSRNRDERETDWSGKKTNRPQRSLNWRVTITRNGREVVSLDYSSGIGHAPCYMQSPPKTDPEYSAYMARLIAETETGFKTKRNPFATGYESDHVSFDMEPDPDPKRAREYKPRRKIAIKPGAVNVLACLAMDSHVLDAGGFESWASDYGYDTDSRAAEKIYRECLEQALKFRAGLGDSALDELRDATRDW